MLQIWRLSPSEAHSAVRSLHASATPKDRAGAQQQKRKNEPTLREMFGTATYKTKKREREFAGWVQQPAPALKKSENAWKPQDATATTREEHLEKTVLGFLNKICPENLTTIVDQLALIDLETACELDVVISVVLQKVLGEPHYCATYA